MDLLLQIPKSLWNVIAHDWVPWILEEHLDLPALAVVLAVVTGWFICAGWASSIAEDRGHSPHLHFLIGIFLPFAYAPLVLLTMPVNAPTTPARKTSSKRRKGDSGQEEEEQDDAALRAISGKKKTAPAEDAADGKYRSLSDLTAQEEATHRQRTPAYLVDDNNLPPGVVVAPRAEMVFARKHAGVAVTTTLGNAPQGEDSVDTAARRAEAANKCPFNQVFFHELEKKSGEDPTRKWRVVYGGHEVLVLNVIEAMPKVVLVQIAGEGASTHRIRIPYPRVERVDEVI